jgi:hypothetical protein
MIEPDDFYNLAVSLYKDHQAYEEYIRTAINRAYYAAYHAWRNFAASKDQSIAEKIKNTHKLKHSTLIEWIRKHDAAMFTHIKTLYDLRTKADYEIKDNITLDDVENALNLSKVLLDYLKGGELNV